MGGHCRFTNPKLARRISTGLLTVTIGTLAYFISGRLMIAAMGGTLALFAHFYIHEHRWCLQVAAIVGIVAFVWGSFLFLAGMGESQPIAEALANVFGAAGILCGLAFILAAWLGRVARLAER